MARTKLSTKERLHACVDAMSETEAEHLLEQVLGVNEPGGAVGGEKPWETVLRISALIPEEVKAAMPVDGAAELDHYIYGWPKRDCLD